MASLFTRSRSRPLSRHTRPRQSASAGTHQAALRVETYAAEVRVELAPRPRAAVKQQTFACFPMESIAASATAVPQALPARSRSAPCHGRTHLANRACRALQGVGGGSARAAGRGLKWRIVSEIRRSYTQRAADAAPGRARFRHITSRASMRTHVAHRRLTRPPDFRIISATVL